MQHLRNMLQKNGTDEQRSPSSPIFGLGVVIFKKDHHFETNTQRPCFKCYVWRTNKFDVFEYRTRRVFEFINDNKPFEYPRFYDADSNKISTIVYIGDSVPFRNMVNCIGLTHTQKKTLSNVRSWNFW